jgi:MFS family permease
MRGRAAPDLPITDPPAVNTRPAPADLNTTVQGVQVAITLFLLVMAALLIPGGKLTEPYGRTRCLTIGLALLLSGATVSTLRGRQGSVGALSDP